MIVVNNRQEQFSLEVPLADGTVIRELVPAGATLEVTDIDPYDINTYKLLRRLVFVEEALDVTFASEPDDLVGLGISRVRDEGVDLGQFFTAINFTGNAVTATPGAEAEVADITITDAKDILVSANDTTPGYLEDKVQAGNAIDLLVVDEGANEKLQVSVGFRRQFLLMGG